MPEHPIPPPLEEFGERAFSFYPPVLGIEHNEWRFVKSTWSELLVRNTASGPEIWIPRRFVGELSRVDEPVMIVGLTKELEYKGGSIWPAQQRVISMPRMPNEAPLAAGEASNSGPASTSQMHFDGGTESRIGKLILGALVIGLVACVVVISIFQGRSGGRVTYNPIMQTELGLQANDDYFDVVRKLGTPTADHWKSEAGEMQYRALEYPSKGIIVILMGIERDKSSYVGAMDKSWKVVHSVRLPGGGDTRAMLLKLPKF